MRYPKRTQYKHTELAIDPSTAMKQRNRNVRSVERQGRRQWHTASGYSQRSLVENTIGRYRGIIGDQTRARSLAGQRVEARLGCRILNIMAQLGMPDSALVA